MEREKNLHGPTLRQHPINSVFLFREFKILNESPNQKNSVPYTTDSLKRKPPKNYKNEINLNLKFNSHYYT